MKFQRLFKRNRKVGKNYSTTLAGIAVTTELNSESIDLEKFLYSSTNKLDTPSFTVCNELKSSCQDLTYFPNS
jgi:hypothetical protein